MRGHKTSTSIPRALTLVATLLLCGASVRAEGTPIPHGTLELVAENQWIAAGHTVYLGLHFQLEKGWHVYWVNPGDSGEPPRVKWELPAGLTVGAMEWPAPQRLGTSSIVDYGYEDAVMLLVPMRAENSLTERRPARIGAQVEVLVCREICIPGKAHLSINLPVKSQYPEKDARTMDLFAGTRKSLPHPAPRNWRFNVAETKDSFVVTAELGRQMTQAIFFPLAESQIDNAAPQKLLSDTEGFRLTLRTSDQLLKPIDRLQGVFVLSDGRAYLINVPVSKPGTLSNRSGVGIHAVQSLKEGSQK